MTNVNNALALSEEIKVIASQNIADFNENMKDTEKLLINSQEMNLIAKDYQKNAHKLEVETNKSNWWMCSKQCVAIFAGLALLLIILYVILNWSLCGLPSCI